MQKARCQAARRRSDERALQLIVGLRFQVLFHSPLGVLFTFPSRYWFTIGHRQVFSLTRWSSQIPTGLHVSRGTWVPESEARALSPTGLSPSVVRLSRAVRLEAQVYDFRRAPHRPNIRSHDPGYATRAGLTRSRFGLFPFRSPLLGESHLLSVPRATEMFQLAPLAAHGYGFTVCWRGFTSPGCPIRRSPDQSLFAAPRRFSQLTTSFIACRCQGIHRRPLVAWP
jgi:hypothetical protein